MTGFIRGLKRFEVLCAVGEHKKAFYVNASSDDAVIDYIESNFVYEMCELGLYIERVQEIF